MFISYYGRWFSSTTHTFPMSCPSNSVVSWFWLDQYFVCIANWVASWFFSVLAWVSTSLGLLIHYCLFCFTVGKIVWLSPSIPFYLSLYAYVFKDISLLRDICLCVEGLPVCSICSFPRCPFSSIVSIRNLGQNHNLVFTCTGSMPWG